MKKVLAILLAMGMTAAMLAACGGSENVTAVRIMSRAKRSRALMILKAPRSVFRPVRQATFMSLMIMVMRTLSASTRVLRLCSL